MGQAEKSIRLSVVAPAHNEAENVTPLIGEIEAALDPLGILYEIVVVDDGSTDNTLDVLRGLLRNHPGLRIVRMTSTPRGRGNGQSAAFHAGFRVARGEWIASMDADRQNDPADLPAMWARLGDGVDMVQGDRTRDRHDSAWRRFSSWFARMFRRVVLGDTIRDTGCSLRLMRREIALSVPLEFRGMHRYIPLTARQMGFRVVEMAVNHRARDSGRTKYGTWDRAVVGPYDCLAVRWMDRRRRPVAYESGIVEGTAADARSLVNSGTSKGQ